VSPRKFYPGDEVGKELAWVQPGIHREYRDSQGNPLTGEVYIRDAYDEPDPAEVVDGRLDIDLPTGSYTLVAVLRDPGGRVYYRNERFVL
jgi:hypothetical protein